MSTFSKIWLKSMITLFYASPPKFKWALVINKWIFISYVAKLNHKLTFILYISSFCFSAWMYHCFRCSRQRKTHQKYTRWSHLSWKHIVQTLDLCIFFSFRTPPSSASLALRSVYTCLIHRTDSLTTNYTCLCLLLHSLVWQQLAHQTPTDQICWSWIAVHESAK